MPVGRDRSLKNFPRYALGAAAAALCGFILAQHPSLPHLLAAIFLLIICITDTISSRIPNLVNLAMILAGLGFHLYHSGPSGLVVFLLGLLTGLALLIVPYLMGGMGAGDVKALAALGAVLGPAEVFQVFLYVGLAGGLMAVLHYLFNATLRTKVLQGLQALKGFFYTHDLRSLLPSGKGETMRFPYAAAMALGFFAFVRWGGIL